MTPNESRELIMGLVLLGCALFYIYWQVLHPLGYTVSRLLELLDERRCRAQKAKLGRPGHWNEQGF